MNIVMNFFVIVLSLFIGLGAIAMAVAIYRLFKAIQSDGKKCEFKHVSGEYCTYNTKCGEVFFDATDTGDPVTEWAKYCPYCGGRISIKDKS